MRSFARILAILILSPCLTSYAQHSDNLLLQTSGRPGDPGILTPDTTICPGQSILLQSTAAELYQWTPRLGLSNDTVRDPTASPLVSTIYTLTQGLTSGNLITNGDFSDGYSNFTSGYSFAINNLNEGEYSVGPSPEIWNTSLYPCRDHTSGGGNMLLVNGSPNNNVVVWSSTVTVPQNTDFAFSTWIESLWPPNPAILSFQINGIEVGNQITASNTTCEWRKFATIWNSGNSTTATISIINKNTLVQGNDFALDDISFSFYTSVVTSVTVNVDESLVKAGNDTTICPHGIVQLSANGAKAYNWSELSGGALASDSPLVGPLATTEYVVEGRSAAGCLSRDTIKISVKEVPAITLSGGTSDRSICRGDTVHLSVKGGSTFLWSPAELVNDPENPNVVLQPSATTDYSVRVTDEGCGADTTITLRITVNDRPDLDVTKSNDVDCNTPGAVLSASGATQYTWTPHDWLDHSEGSRVIARPDTTTTYTVTGSNGAACSAEATVTVKVTNTGSGAYVLPNAFSPNGDNRNDCFGLSGWGEVQLQQFAIFNRWGGLVFSTRDASGCWDGTLQGKPQPAGIYAYSIKAATRCGAVTRTGILLLVR